MILSKEKREQILEDIRIKVENMTIEELREELEKYGIEFSEQIDNK